MRRAVNNAARFRHLSQGIGGYRQRLGYVGGYSGESLTTVRAWQYHHAMINAPRMGDIVAYFDYSKAQRLALVVQYCGLGYCVLCVVPENAEAYLVQSVPHNMSGYDGANTWRALPTPDERNKTGAGESASPAP